MPMKNYNNHGEHWVHSAKILFPLNFPRASPCSPWFVIIIFCLVTLIIVSGGLIYSGATAQDANIIARYQNGNVTEPELNLYLRYLGYQVPNPLKAYNLTQDKGEEIELEAVITGAVEDIVWDREYSQIASTHDFHLKEEQVANIDGAFNKCISEHWIARLSDSFTTLTQSGLLNEFEGHRKDFEHPEMREVSYIFQMTNDTMTLSQKDELFQKLSHVRKDIISDRITFKDAALKYSEAASAANGGYIGLVPEDSTFNKKFVDLVFSTPEKKLSPVTLLHNGYYIVYIHSIVPEKRIDRDEILKSPEIQKRLLTYAREEFIKAQMQKVREAYREARNGIEAISLYAQSQGFKCDDCEILKRILTERNMARSYFFQTYQNDFEPTESEILYYYNTRPSEMNEQGQWKLTKFLIPVSGKKESPVRNREQAIGVIEEVRRSLLDGKKEDEIIKKYSSKGLRILSTGEWVNGSDFAKADEELLKMKNGELTSVFSGREGSFFFRLDDKRALPKLPLEKKRSYIIRNLRSEKYQKCYEENREKLMQQLQMKHLWKKVVKRD